MQETIKNINIDLLIPFKNHPFKKRDGIEKEELTESIKENGLLEPIIVRSFPAGKYEIISGHRRVEACKELGITSIPVLYQGLMEFTEMKQLTPTVVNKLIERIEIHNNEKKHSHNNVKVDIYFTAAGLFDIPTEQQLINTMERVKQKKAEKSA